MNESAEHVDPFDTPDVFDTGGRRIRWRDGHVKVDATVRPGGVVVRDVVGQDVFGVAAVADQHPVEAVGFVKPVLLRCLRILADQSASESGVVGPRR